MLAPSQLQIGQEYNVRLELSEIAPGGVTFAMPSGIHVFLRKKDFDRITEAPSPASTEETLTE